MNENDTKRFQQAFSEDPSLRPGGRGDSPGAGEFGEEGVMSGTGRKRLNTGAFLLVGVVALAAAGLWCMRALSHVGASTAGDTNLELTIEKFLQGIKDGQRAGASGSSSDPGANGVIQVLSESYTERQVPLSDVQRNPFIIFNEVPLPTAQDQSERPDLSERVRAQRRAEFEEAALRFQLKSVIISSDPKAILNDKVVRVGDEIVAQPSGISFRVESITGNSVTVVAEDAALGLSVPVTIQIKRNQ